MYKLYSVLYTTYIIINVIGSKNSPQSELKLQMDQFSKQY